MLSIQIPTITSRKHVFEPLLQELKRQATPFGDKVEILHMTDNKEMPTMQKRRLLYEMTSKPYSVQWDDDDWIHPLGISLIMKELEHNPDSVSYRMIQEFDGSPTENIPGKLLVCDFRKKYKESMLNKYGYDFVEPTCPKCVIKTDIAVWAANQVPDETRYGEDGMFGKILFEHKKLKVERYIDKHIYWYLNLSGEPFGKHKYGLSDIGRPNTFI
ncbi:MAG: hypothetical protein CMO44_11515 [Verrucomicrobiales bacterium]|jgi:hypothetical protein|nr:hypothetical protein [Verrucomicrobiales bacterium]